MTYLQRHIAAVLNQRAKSFPSLLLTGPRQVGKSTVLSETLSSIEKINCDNSRIRSSIMADPLEFLENKGTPLILDEVQQIPALFSQIKVAIDENRANGMYYLTGSQSYALMNNVSESLAGRISIIKLLGFSNRELNNDSFSQPFIPESAYLKSRHPSWQFTTSSLWNRIHRGSMPELYANPEMEWEDFYDAYVETYLERDVRSLTQVGNLLTFRKFMVACAARTGQILNMADIAKDVGIDAKTCKSWISILESSNLIFLLQPFSPNISKRIVKAPKLYFTDTGLAAYFCRWTTPESLENGAMNGAIFETFVFTEILKSFYNAGRKPDIFYFRNTDGQEVDFLLYRDNKLYPIEVKKHSTVDKSDFRNFKTLATYFPSIEIADGGVICTGKEVLPMGEKQYAIPIEWI